MFTFGMAACSGAPGTAGDRAAAIHRSQQQSQADAAWEGLDGDQQRMLTATGETGHWLDELVIEYRKAVTLNPGMKIWVEKDADGRWSTYGID
jgi:hypothetical protein